MFPSLPTFNKFDLSSFPLSLELSLSLLPAKIVEAICKVSIIFSNPRPESDDVYLSDELPLLPYEVYLSRLFLQCSGYTLQKHTSHSEESKIFLMQVKLYLEQFSEADFIFSRH